jgi:prophage maintenance system killer protein
MDPLITPAEMESIQAGIAAGLGDKIGVKSGRALKAALAEPLRQVGNRPVFETGPRRAAALAEALVRSRPFVSCNRRTTVAAVRLWMEREDYRWVASMEELVHLIDQLANRRLSRPDLVLWLGRQTRSNPGPHPGADPGITRIAAKAAFGPGPRSKAPPWILDRTVAEKGWGKGF